jgi:hypothetical protein
MGEHEERSTKIPEMTQDNLFSYARAQIISRFECRGWLVCKPSEGTIYLSMTPNPGISQRLSFRQPFERSNLPGAALGLACIADVCYSELEELIASVLNRDPKRISLILPLCSVVPRGRCYQRVYLINDHASLQRLLDDYDTYLEPVRVRLAEISGFRDEEAPPPAGAWRWKILRAAYLCFYGDRAAALEYCENIEHEANAALAELGPVKSDGIFTNMDDVTTASKQKAADEAKRAAAGLYRRMSRSN